MNNLIIIKLLAKKDRPFTVYNLLQSLLANDFKYGTDKIFHRHLHGDTRSPVMFNLASLSESGTFDLERINEITYPGLVAFMELSKTIDLHAVLDSMITTINQFAMDLDCMILDEINAAVTEETVAKWRDQIDNFKKTHYTYDLFTEYDK
jgi:cell division protein ZipA